MGPASDDDDDDDMMMLSVQVPFEDGFGVERGPSTKHLLSSKWTLRVATMFPRSRVARGGAGGVAQRAAGAAQGAGGAAGAAGVAGAPRLRRGAGAEAGGGEGFWWMVT